MKTNEEYLKSYSHCPKCNSDQIEGRHVDVEADLAYQQISCLEPGCEFVWDDVYQLIRFEKVDEGVRKYDIRRVMVTGDLNWIITGVNSLGMTGGPMMTRENAENLTDRGWDEFFEESIRYFDQDMPSLARLEAIRCLMLTT